MAGRVRSRQFDVFDAIREKKGMSRREFCSLPRPILAEMVRAEVGGKEVSVDAITQAVTEYAMGD